MNKAKFKELVTSLTAEQQQSLYDTVIQRKTEQATSGNIKIPQQYDIAIIGLSGWYPQSDNYYDFWYKLQQGTNFIQGVPESRWDHDQYYNPQVQKSFIPHKTHCKFGAFLKEPDKFDAAFFNLHPDEVCLMDPQERLALETTWACIEDAGYAPENLGEDVGVFSGVAYSEYQKLIPVSNHACMLNNRIAYFFNFQGPAVAIDTGCCSSLTAIHLACQSLMGKECQTAIVVGANIILHPDHYASLSSMLSPTINPFSNPFGTDDGWIPAEGVVSILLKPLKQALQDRDHIYAVIKSSHICQEGKTAWFTAFNPKQQAKLIRENFEKSGIHPETISYVEAAANGSSLGDIIELEGLTTAFNHFTDKRQFCSIGTIKSNVGHGEAVSTLFQLTKVLLQFKTKTLIPLINLKEINTNINIENTPFFFQTTTQKWEPPTVKINENQFAVPRRATISSFGGGGNIGHLILEEHVVEDIKKPTLDFYFIPLSSKTTEQLRQNITGCLKFFEQYGTFGLEQESGYTLLNIMFTLCGRVQFGERVVFIVQNRETLIEQFHQFLNGESNQSIIVKAKAGTMEAITENKQKQVQSYMENRSWYELAELWVRGLQISWEKFFSSYNVQRLSLPTYCFQRQSFPIPRPADIKAPEKSSVAKTSGKEGNNLDNPSQGKSKAAISPTDQVKNPSYCEIGTNSKIIRILTEIFAEVLNIPVTQVDLFTPLAEYGFNSAMVLFIADKLERYFGAVPKTVFFECRTIQDVINYFNKKYRDNIKMIVQNNENKTHSEQFVEYPVQCATDPANNGMLYDEPEELAGSDDLIKDLAKAILSGGISKQTVFEKL